ncbi:MAG: hypothetical protein ACXVDD_11730 [Polyangia bacterium]
MIIAERLAHSRAAARASLAAAGTLRRVRDDRPLEMPRGFERAFSAALDEERRTGSPRAEALERHYLDVMPRLRTQQLDSTAPEVARFFDMQIEWQRWPRLAAAVERLGRSDLFAAAPTLGALYADSCYGGFMPMLYGSAYDLASYDLASLDRHLAAPLVHELAHGARHHAVLSLYVDECIAGWLGTRALDGDNDLFAAPWLSQVGAALARVVGADRLRAAHAGALAWDAVLPPGLGAAIALVAWQDYLAQRPLHLLSDATRPDRWMRMFFLAAAGAPLDDRPWREIPAGDESEADAEILDDALRAMCLRNHQEQRSFRVTRRPPPAAITIDLDECRVSTAAGEDGFDPAPPAHLFPPATAARLRARGIAGYTVELAALDALPPLARAIQDGAASRASDGFVLTRR